MISVLMTDFISPPEMSIWVPKYQFYLQKYIYISKIRSLNTLQRVIKLFSATAMSTISCSISKTRKSPPHRSYIMLILFTRIYNSNVHLKLMALSIFWIFSCTEPNRTSKYKFTENLHLLVKRFTSILITPLNTN